MFVILVNMGLYTAPNGVFDFMSLRSFHYRSRQRLTEQNITKTNRHRLGLDVVVQSSLTKLPADARLFVPTKWQLPMKSIVGVDPDGTSAEGVGNLNGCVEVGGVDGGGKAVCCRIANLDDLGLVLELGDRAHGAEDLLLLDLHVLGNVGEDGGLNEVTLVALALTTSLNRGTGLLTVLNVAATVLQADTTTTTTTYLMMRSNCSCET
jgi:hypothetical protein